MYTSKSKYSKNDLNKSFNKYAKKTKKNNTKKNKTKQEKTRKKWKQSRIRF